MHEPVYQLMKGLVEKYVHPRFPNGGSVLDVGSMQVNADEPTHRMLFDGKWTYTGLDAREGDNVDVVADILGWAPDRKYDVVISGQMLEHCEAPWDAVPMMMLCLRHNGLILLTAPFMWHIHAHPEDYWRFTGEGLAELCRRTAFNVLECGQVELRANHADAWCVAEKS